MHLCTQKRAKYAEQKHKHGNLLIYTKIMLTKTSTIINTQKLTKKHSNKRTDISPAATALLKARASSTLPF